MSVSPSPEAVAVPTRRWFVRDATGCQTDASSDAATARPPDLWDKEYSRQEVARDHEASRSSSGVAWTGRRSATIETDGRRQVATAQRRHCRAL